MVNSKRKADSLTLKDLPTYKLGGQDEKGKSIAKGGVACPFPWRLHECLTAVEKEGLQDIISFQPHGRSFTVFQPKKFEALVMPRFFGQTRYASFQRQLNIYGFNRFLQGRDKGAYYHLCFVRDNRPLVRGMVRRKIKGNQAQQTLPIDEDELNFYDPVWKDHVEPTIPKALLSRFSANTNELSASPVSSPNAVDVNRSVSPVEPDHLNRSIATSPAVSVRTMLSSPALIGSNVRASTPPSDCMTQVSTNSDDNHSVGSSFSNNEDYLGFPSYLLDPTPLREYNDFGISTYMQLVDAGRNIFVL